LNSSFIVHGLVSRLIIPGDDIVTRLLEALEKAGSGPLQDGDILIFAESTVATADCRVIPLDSIQPSKAAEEYAETYAMDARLAELVLRESDAIVGGIHGFLLCMKDGTLLPNAGVDLSNAPPGCAVLLPEDPDRSAVMIRREVRDRGGADVGVIIADSRVHPMRSGCCGIAVGCAGIPAVLNTGHGKDFSGRPHSIPQRAVADCIASAAELVMGESDEAVPFAVVRWLGLPISDCSGVPVVDVKDCIYMRIFHNRFDPGDKEAEEN